MENCSSDVLILVSSQRVPKSPKNANHRLRHWWESTAARVDLQDSLVDAVQVHAGSSVASTYRHFDLRALAKGVAAISVLRRKRAMKLMLPWGCRRLVFGKFNT
jgi:hypothetical protein